MNRFINMYILKYTYKGRSYVHKQRKREGTDKQPYY